MKSTSRDLRFVLFALAAAIFPAAGLGPSTAIAQNKGYWMENSLFEKCSDRLSEQQRLEFKKLAASDRLSWLEANCAEEKSGGRSKAWQMYVRCKPYLTPAQTKEFESSDWEQRKQFLVKNCKEAAKEVLAEDKPVAESAPGGLPAEPVPDEIPKVAVLGIVDETGMDPVDVATLGAIVEKVVKEESHGRYRVVVVASEEAEFCDERCLVEKAGEAGAKYVITGELDSFAGGVVLSLSLRNTDEELILSGAETESVELSALPGEARSATEVLIARGPFGEPEILASASSVQAAVVSEQSTYVGPATPHYRDVEPVGRAKLRPPGYAGPRVAAHIFFWMGLNLVAGGAIWMAIDVPELGVPMLSAGGVFWIVAAICAGVYSRRREERRKWNLVYGGPVVTPSFAGFGLSKSF